MKEIVSEFSPGIIGVSTGITPRFNQFFDCLDVLQVPKGSVYVRAQDTSIARNRNDLIRTMLSMGPLRDKLKAGWIFFLDDDHEFDPAVLMRKFALWRELDVEAVGSLYVKKVPPFEPVVYKRIDGKGNDRFTWAELAAEKDAGFIDAAACGGGGLFVSRTALEKMLGDKPIAEGDWFPEMYSRAEDIGFCRSLKEAGFDLVVDLALPIGHTMPSTATPEWFEGEWFISISYGSKGYRLPAKMFHP